MKTFQLDEKYSVVCEFKKTRQAFKHVAHIIKHGDSVYETKCCYQNRTWESYEFQEAAHKAIRGYFKGEQANEFMKIADDRARDIEAKRFDPVKAVCAFGDLLCNTTDEKVDWKKRMVGTIPGISFPDDFDSLPAEERDRRISAALEVL